MEDFEKNRLNAISVLLTNAKEIYIDVTDETKLEISNLHYPSYSLDFCLEWGAQAIEDIKEEFHL